MKLGSEEVSPFDLQNSKDLLAGAKCVRQCHLGHQRFHSRTLHLDVIAIMLWMTSVHTIFVLYLLEWFQLLLSSLIPKQLPFAPLLRVNNTHL